MPTVISGTTLNALTTVSWGVMSLFANNEQGVWFDPSDLTTMFQDSAGTTPVTAVEQPVGLLLDKSKGLALGSELVTNGTFDSGITGWTKGAGTTDPISWDSSGKRLIITNDIAYFGFASQTLSGLTVGKTYLVTGVISGSTVETRIQIAFLDAGTSLILPAGGGTARFVFAATSTSHSLVLQNTQSTLNGISYWDNISVKELPGNHARQSTDASRPVLSARVNLLTYTEDLTNGVWTKDFVTVTAGNLVYPSSSGSSRYVWQSRSGQTTGVTFRTVLRVKNGGKNFAYIYTVRANTLFYVNLTTGVTSNVGANITNLSTSVASDGWVDVSFDSVLLDAQTIAYIFVGPSDAAGSTSVTANGTDGIYVNKLDLRVTNVGVGIPAYQRVVTATDYDTSGFPLYLRFDGSDDSLATGSIDFTATDKMSVFAGLRKLGTASTEFIAETSGNYAVNAGAFVLGARGSATDFFAFTGGTFTPGTYNDNFFETDAVPATFVFTGTIDISQASIANESNVRLNGATTSQTHAGTDQTGNFGNYPLYIGRRGGISAPFAGHLYSLIIRGALSNSVDITNTEAYINSKTKAY